MTALAPETVTARGILRHRFWGTYSAKIVLEFPDAASATDALRTLGRDPGWGTAKGEENAKYLLWIGDSDALDALKVALAERITPEPCNAFGCRNARHDIDGLEHSVDFGAPFTLTVPIVPAEQLGLEVES